MRFYCREAIIPKDQPTDTFRLYLTMEHGDADHTTHETYETTDENKVKTLIKILAVGFDIPSYENSELRKAINEVGEELGVEYAEDTYSDLVGYDITYSDYYAQLEKIVLTYFNEEGVEFKMDIEIDDNGTILEYLSRYNVRNV